jgi:hypothetical protein
VNPGTVDAQEDYLGVVVLEVFFPALDTTVHLTFGLLLSCPKARG